MALAFVISIIPIGIIIIPMSLQYFPVILITLISLIVLFKCYSNGKFDKAMYFLIIGATTAFLDLLTVPLITLGIPMIFLVLLENQYNKEKNNLIIMVIKLSILWITSYCFTYLIHWIITSIILEKNIVFAALEQAIYRVGNKTGVRKFSRMDAIKKNYYIFFNKINTVFLGVYCIYYIVNYYKGNQKNINIKTIISLVIVGIMPYIWYLTLANHSIEHFWMTYRIQIITILSFFAITTSTTNNFLDKDVIEEEANGKKTKKIKY